MTANAARFLAALGATYAPPGETHREPLDPGLEAALTAIAARLIPGDEHWPSAGRVEAAAHVAAVLDRSPVLRPAVLGLIAAAGEDFAARPAGQQDETLRRLEADPDHAAAFRAVYEWVCEAYYRHPLVQPVILERTGFDLSRPLVGTDLPPFDETRLDRVRALPPRYREVPA